MVSKRKNGDINYSVKIALFCMVLQASEPTKLSVGLNLTANLLALVKMFAVGVTF